MSFKMIVYFLFLRNNGFNENSVFVKFVFSSLMDFSEPLTPQCELRIFEREPVA